MKKAKAFIDKSELINVKSYLQGQFESFNIQELPCILCELPFKFTNAENRQYKIKDNISICPSCYQREDLEELCSINKKLEKKEYIFGIDDGNIRREQGLYQKLIARKDFSKEFMELPLLDEWFERMKDKVAATIVNCSHCNKEMKNNI